MFHSSLNPLYDYTIELNANFVAACSHLEGSNCMQYPLNLIINAYTVSSQAPPSGSCRQAECQPL